MAVRAGQEIKHPANIRRPSSLRQGIWASREVRPDADEHAEAMTWRMARGLAQRARRRRVRLSTTAPSNVYRECPRKS
ncbi:hypothetical protein FNF27_03795 [Cafeteria roenbergensis]|nr:hypothetical protein FNF28_06118 [Cafeteria roenbergensis]KAA0174672.1 hypothetical protein FNF27_03795 [Cafeteria roenbergensis]